MQLKLEERLKVMDENLLALHEGQTMMDKNIQILMEKPDLMNKGKEQEVRDKIITPAKEHGKTQVDIMETSTTAIPLSLTMGNLSQESDSLTQEESLGTGMTKEQFDTIMSNAQSKRMAASRINQVEPPAKKPGSTHSTWTAWQGTMKSTKK